MSLLREMASSLEPSKAVFKIKVSEDGSGVEFEVKDPVKHTCPASEDPIKSLICSYYQESVDMESRRLVNTTSLNFVSSSIVKTLISFSFKSSHLKNPRQSKLFKWIDHLDYSHDTEYMPGLIALYRYLVKSGIYDMELNKFDKRIDDQTDPNVKNVIAILELMRAKYERV